MKIKSNEKMLVEVHLNIQKEIFKTYDRMAEQKNARRVDERMEGTTEH